MLRKKSKTGAFLYGALLTAVVCGAWTATAQAEKFQTLNEKEAAAKARWLGAKFDGIDTTTVATPKLGVEVLKNHDPVLVDKRYDKTLKIADKTFNKGLYCHAPSELIVRLPKKAKRFTAVVGIDTNAPETANGGGSVKFAVKSNDVGLYESELMTGGKAGAPVDVALNGAQEFALLIDPQGNISCDQSDWADAKVEYEDGEVVYLSDLELTDSGTYDRTFEVDFPFSFVYDGKSSRTFLKDWKVERAKEGIDGKVLRRLTLTEPGDRLQVACEAIDYVGYPFVEWSLKFKNLSDVDTPIIENIKPIDAIFGRDAFERRPYSGWDPNCGDAARWNDEREFKLHYSVGSPCRIDDYMPLTTVLNPGAVKDVATSGGRPTNAYMPYFNLESLDKGWIIVLGWSGQWAAKFERQGALETRVAAGQELTRFKLLAGEEVRSPIAVVGPWFRDDWFAAQNIWRRWMVEWNVPRVPDKANPNNKKGKVVESHLAACSSHFFAEMTQATTETQNQFIDLYLERGLKLDYWWMDAGWYPCDGSWPKTGTWEVDQTRFPGGFRPITDRGRAKGVESIVWFEPERVHSGTWLPENHPEWIFGGKDGGLLNLGNPEALDWLTNHVDGLLKKEGIDFYRQDYNIDPLSFWRNADPEDRQGISEIRYVEGYLKYWDALLERNPGLRIDSCASGGRRNDLETLRRAVPLLRSDYLLEPVGQQIHSYGMALWIPYFGSGTRAFDDYKIRSLFVPYFNFCYDIRDDEADWDVVRKNLAIWRDTVAPYFGADYYPLTSISTAQDVWVGWQYHRDADNSGIIQMFRRPDSTMVAGRFKLRGLDENAIYEIENVDTGAIVKASGAELSSKGLLIEIDDAPNATILKYRAVAVPARKINAVK